MHLYVKTKILYIMRYVTGNQCNSRSTGVMCSQERVRVTSLAAEFWILWNLQCATPEGHKEGCYIDQDGM